jgi:hypothetical protein
MRGIARLFIGLGCGVIVLAVAYMFVTPGSTLDLEIELFWMRNGIVPVLIFLLAVGLISVAFQPGSRS